MATYQINYSCGHTVTKQLVGKEADRSRYIAWAAKSGLCEECHKADAAAAVDAMEVEFALPPLTGSDKQVAWARKIRADKIADVRKWMDGLRAQAERLGKIEEYETEAAAIMQMLAEKTEARYWIDNRDRPGVTMAQDAYKAARK